MRHLVLIDHLGLFHLLNGDDLLGFLVSADAHLSKGTAPDDFEGLEVADSDLGAREAEQFCLLVLYLLLNQLLLLSRQVHLVHLLQELIPRYTLITNHHDPYLPSSPSPRSSASHTSSLCMPSPPLPSLWSPGSAERWPPLAASTATAAAAELATTITAVGLATDAAATAAGSEATTIVAVLIAATVRAPGQEGLAT